MKPDPLTTDSLALLFIMATRGPETHLKYPGVKDLLHIPRTLVLDAVQPLLLRGWISGAAHSGYTLTPSGLQHALAITSQLKLTF